MTDRSDFAIVDRRSISRHAFLGIEERTVRTPDGTTVDRIIVTHPGAVAIVALVGDDIVLIRQYRAAAEQTILEIPAGKLDPTDVSFRDAAARELAEETGFVASSFTPLTTMWTAVGFSDEQITILLAEGLAPGTAAPEGAEERAAQIVRMPFNDAVALVVGGQITDSKSIAGILIADAHRRTT